MTRILQAPARMRAVIATLVIAGCAGEPKLVMKPLPPLAEPQAASARQEIAVRELGLVVGEHLIWDVQVRGFSIGRVELRVDADTVQSQFRTGTLASAFKSLGHDLVTVLDRAAGRPQTSAERVDFAGKLRHFSTQFAGTRTHSFHTALGAIRAWATGPSAPAGFLNVTHADQVFRLELEAPLAQEGMLRIDGRVTGEDTSFAITIWIDQEKLPVRIEIRDGEDQVTAELIES